MRYLINPFCVCHFRKFFVFKVRTRFCQTLAASSFQVCVRACTRWWMCFDLLIRWLNFEAARCRCMYYKSERRLFSCAHVWSDEKVHRSSKWSEGNCDIFSKVIQFYLRTASTVCFTARFFIIRSTSWWLRLYQIFVLHCFWDFGFNFLTTANTFSQWFAHIGFRSRQGNSLLIH